MFRPLTMIGTFVIAIAVFSFLLIPGFRGSPLGIAVLVFCLAIGGFAIIKDLRDFWNELKSRPENKSGGKGQDGPQA